MRSKRRLVALAAPLVAGAILAVPPPVGAASPRVLSPASAVPPPDGTISAAAARALSDGYLVPDPEAYAAAKRRASDAPPAFDPAGDSRAPATGRGWAGLFDPSVAPSDTTSAVGRTRYVQVVNRKFAIYNKTSDTPIATNSLSALAGFAGTTGYPQIIWDGQTDRFYYAMQVIVSNSDHRLAIGYSKTGSPNSGAAGFCHYSVDYGTSFPDFPRLGDTSHFLLVGTNVFTGFGFFSRSEVLWMTKPPAGTGATCVTPSAGFESLLKDPNSADALSPVPANQVDPSPTGYVVARTTAVPSTKLSLHTVTRNADGSANIQVTGRAVTVPSYDIPPHAEQRFGYANDDKRLDTLDARPGQSTLAFDPGRGVVALWTQHTVAGGAGAEVRWYEIRPYTAARLASGKATSASYSAFNGAISPDRVALSSGARRFGQSMVLSFSTSGLGSFPAVRQLSKVGTAPQSAHQLVKAAETNYVGPDCAGTPAVCRWGNWSGASPDPTPPSDATRGLVWSTNQYPSGGTSPAQANWRTWNWVTTP